MISDQEFALLLLDYERVFGARAPLMQLPPDPDKAAEILREAIARRDSGIIDRLIPPDALA